MHRAALLCAWLTTLAGGDPARAQWQKHERELQVEAARHMEPAPLVARCRAEAAPPRVMRVRFYADGEYREQGTHWQDRARGQLAELNQLLLPAFGVRLEADGFRRWDRGVGPGKVAGLLEQLAVLDPGQDVDWVVGLVAPLPVVSQVFHDLGGARSPGRHLVVRGIASLAELEELKRAFPTLSGADRDKLYNRRKSHKERAIFLHQWVHTLGIGDIQSPAGILSAGYSNRTSLFEEPQCRSIQTALAKRASPTQKTGTVADPTLPRLPPPGALGGRPPGR